MRIVESMSHFYLDVERVDNLFYKAKFSLHLHNKKNCQYFIILLKGTLEKSFTKLIEDAEKLKIDDYGFLKDNGD